MRRVDLSIIIVNYKAGESLFRCLDSIVSSVKGVGYEVIVVENDINTNLSKELKKYKFVKYIRPDSNLGYGTGNNLGVDHAEGKYVFILNPDTEIRKGNVKLLLNKFKKPKVGLVAPILVDSKNNPYILQGTDKLNPINAVFSLSILNKVWPNNPIAKKYWMKGLDRSKDTLVKVAPGTAFLMERKLFNNIGGFDENFFLYFEEHDLCDRIVDKGYKVYISPDLEVYHAWGLSTKKNKESNTFFSKSRYYYLKKHYGFLPALFTTWILNFNLEYLILFSTIVLGTFLRLDRPGLAIFIQDQGWFYLSARNMILTGTIPLVGITSSHTWLHQGAFWTYLLAPFLSTFNFNPYAGFYLAAMFGIGSIVLTYKVGKRFINKNFGLLAAVLYAASPLVVIHERMAYHTAPISFFVLLLIYSLNKWEKGNVYFFSISIFIMSILYNLELATVVFWPVIGLIWLIGFYNKRKFVQDTLGRNIIFLSLFCLVLPMVPIILYDINHGYVQTVKYAAWLIYNPLTSLLKSGSSSSSGIIFFSYLHIQRIIFLKSIFLSIIILLASIFIVFLDAIKKITSSVGIIFIATVIPIAAYIVSKTPSEAYLPMLFPGIILSLAYFFYKIFLLNNKLAIVLVVIFVGVNAYQVYSNDYLIEKPYGYGLPIEKRIETSKKIISLTHGKPYNLIYQSSGKQIKYSTENYEYLTAWLGNPPVSYPVSAKIVVFEGEHGIKLTSLDVK
ncbi:MAG TPA: glycosyltransferase [Patescibacteria group bacterium]|nr:glycosyltransferase [Patescibacteria group bacterium]